MFYFCEMPINNDTRKTITIIIVLMILAGIVINYNMKVTFGTNLILLGIIGYIGISLSRSS